MQILLASENYWKKLLVITSILLLQVTPGLQKTLLDEVDDVDTVTSCLSIHYSIYYSCST